jgi:hypothetical protein
MKDQARLPRRASACSLDTAADPMGFLGMPRRDSTSSLRTLRSLGSTCTREEEVGKSASLKRTVAKKLSSLLEGDSSRGLWNKIGSLSSLKSPRRRSEETEGEEDSNIASAKLKKRMSRRLSSMFDTGSCEKVSEARQRPVLPICPPAPAQLRAVKRTDMPVCWLALAACKPPPCPQPRDLLTRLSGRIYTRHLARAIIKLLRPEVRRRHGRVRF